MERSSEALKSDRFISDDNQCDRHILRHKMAILRVLFSIHFNELFERNLIHESNSLRDSHSSVNNIRQQLFVKCLRWRHNSWRVI
jgi:hypothetical protein